MNKCKRCGKPVTDRHICEKPERSAEGGFLSGLVEAVADALADAADSFDFD